MDGAIEGGFSCNCRVLSIDCNGKHLAVTATRDNMRCRDCLDGSNSECAQVETEHKLLALNVETTEVT